MATAWKWIASWPSLYDSVLAPTYNLNALVNYPYMGWELMIGSLVFYVVVMLWYWPKPQSKPVKSRGLSKFGIFLHNLILMAYSMLIFYETIPILADGITKYGSFYEATIKYKGLVGRKMMFWAWTFYLSKMYEFLDTFILCWKNVNPSFLQVYHHIGAVLAMWWVVKCDCPLTWAWVIMNSFIHSIMYFYYAATTVGIRPPGKQIITLSQIAQFILGNLFSTGRYWPEDSTYEQKLCIWVNQAYTVGLIILFSNFSYHTYFKKSSKPSKSKAA